MPSSSFPLSFLYVPVGHPGGSFRIIGWGQTLLDQRDWESASMKYSARQHDTLSVAYRNSNPTRGDLRATKCLKKGPQ